MAGAQAVCGPQGGESWEAKAGEAVCVAKRRNFILRACKVLLSRGGTLSDQSGVIKVILVRDFRA